MAARGDRKGATLTSNNFPHLKAREIVRIKTTRMYKLIFLLTIKPGCQLNCSLIMPQST